VRLFSRFALPLAALLVLLPAHAQRPSSSSSSSGEPAEERPSSTVIPRRVEQAGSAVSLETSETMFAMAAALNSCGYDNGLESSLPVRAQVRSDINAALDRSVDVRESQIALCKYIRSHAQDGAQNLAQYVSLALFLSPELTLSVSEGDLSPDAGQVVGVIPLLQDFAKKAQLHLIFVRHHVEYEAAVAQAHDSMTALLLETNSYLHQPVSVYDGRRFLVLLEPMLSPQAVNARVYGSDYFVVTSPTRIDETTAVKSSYGSRLSIGSHAGGLQMEQIKHIYLLYQVDPLIYARAQATNRLLPILKVIQDAPIDFAYKNDIVAFTTECLVKAIEARLMDVGFDKPRKPSAVKARADIDNYNLALIEYDRRAEAVRRKQTVLDMESGWVLAGPFYDALEKEDREGITLRDSIAEMVYGMDVPHEVDAAKKIPFFAPNSSNLVAGAGVTRARAPKRTFTVMDQAELKLQNGDKLGAEEIAEKQLAANPADAEAQYMIARLKLLQGDPQGAFDRFQKIVATGKDARTVAWSHVYLGRLYDAQQNPDRAKAVAEYTAALNAPGAQADVRAAAQQGIRQPFAAPKRTVQNSDQRPDDDEELDPTGKKQKESYKPSEERTPTPR
jgi:tetratricopeptide (TPR) repeat protein